MNHNLDSRAPRGCFLPRTSSRSRGGIFGTLALAWLIAEVMAVSGVAQDQLRDFTKPILVLNTQGHHAPIRAVVFGPDGRQVLSAGFDKVVNVWELGAGKARLGATLRPPIWRGPAGSINAMALTASAPDEGKHVLAIAGYGVSSRRGEIALFHFPDASGARTGDHFALLLNDDPARNEDPNHRAATGHADVVTSLAFDPSGNLLVSGSNDATARVWDWKNRRTTAVLGEHQGAVKAVAFTPDGKYIVTGSDDGFVRLWEVARPAAPVARAFVPARAANDAIGIQINALAVSGDGRWVVVGREDGRIIRYDAQTLANGVLLSDRLETIETLALSHDGSTLATSSIGRLNGKAEYPSFACTVRVQSMPDGGNAREVLKLDNIAYAFAFSPDDRTLAVAGGDRQGITLIERGNNAWNAQLDLRGTGRTVWDVGLRIDQQGGLAVGFAHEPDQNPLSALARPARLYRGFHLPDREITTFDPAELSRSVNTFEGWTIRPVDQFTLEVSNAGPPARSVRFALDERKDRRWMSYSFVPPGPGHPRVTVAVGCDSGVWFYRADDGRPTRLYSGHSGPVYCLAPSSDGRWLATGSSDQTVRLWTLDGCDTPPTLGAEFGPGANGTRVVTAVTPLGFADAMGLEKGDVPTAYALDGKIVSETDFLARYEAQVPNTRIELIVRRRAANGAEELVAVGTSRRDSPAASLFLSEDNEWVLWMPRGYYDTSIAGDAKLLGWHINQSKLFPARPTDYLEILKFEKQFRQPKRSQPNKLDTLLQSARVDLALAVPFPPPVARAPVLAPADFVQQWQPPDVTPAVTPQPGQRITTVEGTPVAAQAPLPEKVVVDSPAGGAARLDLRLAIDALGRSSARSLKLLLNGRTIRAFDQLAASRAESVTLSVPPGTHRIAAEVENEQGIKRTVTRDIVVRGPQPTRSGRLKVLTLAPTFSDTQLPQIKFADRDARDLRKFLKAHVVSGHDGSTPSTPEEIALDGAAATVEQVTQSFQALSQESFAEDDVVVVVIESHVLNRGRSRTIAVADGRGIPPEPAVGADELASYLGEVVKYKCRVIVLLDGVHTRSSKLWDTDVNEWVRELRDKHNIITMVASNSGASRFVNDRGHRVFAQSVLDSVRPPFLTEGPLTLNDFRDRVVEGVLNLTGRQQQSACYLPDTMNGEFPFISPRATDK